MQGKCPRSALQCHYSHDAVPPQIMELCKFYLFERCAKKDKCLYLHKGFPCKFYHTGQRCMDTAETCKFSHEPLSDVTRKILLKVPRSIAFTAPRGWPSNERVIFLNCSTLKRPPTKFWATFLATTANRRSPSSFKRKPKIKAGTRTTTRSSLTRNR